MDRVIRWGILGAGQVAHRLAPSLLASRTGRLVACASSDPGRSEAFAARFGGRALGGYEALIEDPEVDLVYVALAHHLHRPWAIAAARAGKGVLCEKPLAPNAADAEAIIEAISERFGLEGYMFRFLPQTRAAIEIVAEGRIGTPRVLSVEMGSRMAWDRRTFRTDPRLGGGALYDVGAHCLSLALLWGGTPTTGTYVAHRPEGYDAYGVGTLSFESGFLCRFGCGLHVPMRAGAVVYGDSGFLRIEDPWKSSVGSSMTLTLYAEGTQTWAFPTPDERLFLAEIEAVGAQFGCGECREMPLSESRTLARSLAGLAGGAFGSPV